MLPMLLGKFRDDVAESLGMELSALPRRSGPVKVVKLDDLTSSELGTLTDAVLVLLTRFTALMDDPLLSEPPGTLSCAAHPRAPPCRPGSPRRPAPPDEKA
jgi:hypothetical protein